jgi:hypothetical protein
MKAEMNDKAKEAPKSPTPKNSPEIERIRKKVEKRYKTPDEREALPSDVPVPEPTPAVDDRPECARPGTAEAGVPPKAPPTPEQVQAQQREQRAAPAEKDAEPKRTVPARKPVTKAAANKAAKAIRGAKPKARAKAGKK